MGHPLVNDLTKLSDEELHKKRGELANRLSFAFRSGHTTMCHQIQLLAQDYQSEIDRRNQKMLEDLQKNNPNFKDLIDIS